MPRACPVESHVSCYQAKGIKSRCHGLAPWSITLPAPEQRNDPRGKPVAFVSFALMLASSKPNNPRDKPVGFEASFGRHHHHSPLPPDGDDRAAQSAAVGEVVHVQAPGRGAEAIGQKITEEAREVVAAATEVGEEGRQHLVREAADLMYHLLVMLAHRDTRLEEVEAELARRFGISGLEEKAARGKNGP